MWPAVGPPRCSSSATSCHTLLARACRPGRERRESSCADVREGHEQILPGVEVWLVVPLSKRQMTQTQSSRPPHRSEPVELEALEAVYRDLPVWGPLLVVAIAIALDVALPNKLRLGPRWLLPGLEALLLVGLAMASPSCRARHHRRRRAVVLTLIALVSATNAVSLALLVHYLVAGGHETGKDLIFAGALLWV